MASDQFEIINILIDAENGGHRLDRFLGTNERIGSRSRAVQLLEKGYITINGKPAKASLFLKKGDNIIVKIPITPEPSELQPLNFKLDIVFEDDDIIVVNKPAGLVVHPAAGHQQDTLVNALLNYTDKLSMGFNETRPGIVHRIDRDTSGLLVVARNDAAHKSLAEQFKQKTTHRVYWAIVFGVYAEASGKFQSLLARHPKDRKKFASTKGDGKVAITHYTQLKTYRGEVALLKLRLETGRTHQIRVHVSESGHPIVGDRLYGSDAKLKNVKNKELRTQIEAMERFALHACELGFKHPTTGEDLHFKVDWPEDLKSLVTTMGIE